MSSGLRNLFINFKVEKPEVEELTAEQKTEKELTVKDLKDIRDALKKFTGIYQSQALSAGEVAEQAMKTVMGHEAELGEKWTQDLMAAITMSILKGKRLSKTFMKQMERIEGDVKRIGMPGQDVGLTKAILTAYQEETRQRHVVGDPITTQQSLAEIIPELKGVGQQVQLKTKTGRLLYADFVVGKAENAYHKIVEVKGLLSPSAAAGFRQRIDELKQSKATGDVDQIKMEELDVYVAVMSGPALAVFETMKKRMAAEEGIDIQLKPYDIGALGQRMLSSLMSKEEGVKIVRDLFEKIGGELESHIPGITEKMGKVFDAMTVKTGSIVIGKPPYQIRMESPAKGWVGVLRKAFKQLTEFFGGQEAMEALTGSQDIIARLTGAGALTVDPRLGGSRIRGASGKIKSIKELDALQMLQRAMRGEGNLRDRFRSLLGQPGSSQASLLERFRSGLGQPTLREGEEEQLIEDLSGQVGPGPEEPEFGPRRIGPGKPTKRSRWQRLKGALTRKGLGKFFRGQMGIVPMDLSRQAWGRMGPQQRMEAMEATRRQSVNLVINSERVVLGEDILKEGTNISYSTFIRKITGHG